MAQSLKTSHGGASLSSKVQLLSMKTVQPITMVSTSSWTMEVEAVTHALRWIASRGDSRTTYATILTDSMNLLQKVKNRIGIPDWNMSKVDIHFHKILYAPPWTSVLRLERSEVLRRLRHYMQAQSQGHHTIDRQEERGVERGSARRSSLKGRERAIVNQTNIGTISKATLGKRLRDGVERIWGFPSA